jgi:hypothetical protein
MAKNRQIIHVDMDAFYAVCPMYPIVIKAAYNRNALLAMFIITVAIWSAIVPKEYVSGKCDATGQTILLRTWDTGEASLTVGVLQGRVFV